MDFQRRLNQRSEMLTKKEKNIDQSIISQQLLVQKEENDKKWRVNFWIFVMIY